MEETAYYGAIAALIAFGLLPAILGTLDGSRVLLGWPERQPPS
jgi:hypothetical protein